jgi:hypothetical protein
VLGARSEPTGARELEQVVVADPLLAELSTCPQGMGTFELCALLDRATRSDDAAVLRAGLKLIDERQVKQAPHLRRRLVERLAGR